jgi:AraC family transcriptional regulator of arabinose operon
MQLTLADHDEYSEIEARFAEIVRRCQVGGAHSELLAMTSLEEVLIGCHAANPLIAQARTDPRVEAAMQFIREHIGQPITLPDLAIECSLSPSRLGRLFHTQTGQTPQQEVRVQTAMQLLDLTNRPVAAIAQSVGFENPFYFSLRFKRATGMSPSAYRNRLNPAPSDP